MKVKFLSVLAMVILFAACKNPAVNIQSDNGGNTYTVTFDKNGGDTEASPRTKTVTTPATTIGSLPTAPTREDDAFDKWTMNKDGSGDEFTAETTVNKDITVYARWGNAGEPKTFTVKLNITGKESSDSVNISLGDTQAVNNEIASVKAEDEITISYTLANTKAKNQLTFSGTNVSIGKVDEAGSGTRTYTVNENAAGPDRVITIIATFTHTDKEFDTIAFAGSEDETKTYGDNNNKFTKTAATSSGTGAISYSSGNTGVATVNASSGEVTIVKVGNTTITATRAADANYESATASYNLIVNQRQLTVSGTVVTKSKAYDKTTTAAVTTVGTLGGVISGDTVTVNAAAAYNTADAGASKTITVTYTISGAQAGNYIKPVDSTFNDGEITKAPGGTVAAPTAASKTVNSVTINAVSPPSTGQSVEYNYSTGSTEPSSGWRTTELTFSGLLANTDYYFFARSAANDNYLVGTANSAMIKTEAQIYAIKLDITGKEGGDSVTLSSNSAGAGAVITVSYTLANTKDKNQLTFSGVTGVIGPVTTPGSSTWSYTVNNSDAAGGTITINAVFTHTNKLINTIAFAESGNTTKTYGDAKFTRAVSNTGSGSGAISYSSSVPSVATVTSSGEVTIVRAGTTEITATKAADADYEAATASYTLTVDQKQLTVSGTVVTKSKAYDKTTTAAVTNAGTLGGRVGSDTVTVSASAVYNNASVGTGKTITVSYTLGGTSAGNYKAPVNSTVNDGVITAKQLTISNPTITKSKEYDNNNTAAVTVGALSGILSGDTVTVTAAGTYNNASVGTGKTITVIYTLGGANASNYSAPANASVTDGAITAKQLTISGTNITKTKAYDREMTAAVTAGTLSGMLSGDTVTVTATAVYDNANVGTGKTITVVYTLGGAQAGNYTKPVNATANDGVITAKQLTISGTAVTKSKTYNTNTTAAVTAGTLAGVLTGDTVTVSVSAAYDDANAGTGKTITVTYSLGGAQAANYIAPVSTTSNDGVITKAAGEAVSAPTLSTKTTTSITVNAVTAPSTGQSVEYGRSSASATAPTTWQSGTQFTGLTNGSTYYIHARSASNTNYDAGARATSVGITTGAATPFPHPVDFEADTTGKTYDSTKSNTGAGATIAVAADPVNSGQKSLQVSSDNYNQAAIVPINLSTTLNNATSFSFRFLRVSGTISYKNIVVYIASDPSVFINGAFGNDAGGSNPDFAAYKVGQTGQINNPTTGNWDRHSISITGSSLNSAISGLSGNAYLAIGMNSNDASVYMFDDLTFSFPKSTGAAVSGNVSVSSITNTGATVSASLTSGTGQTVEYAVTTSSTEPGSGWKDSGTFTGLFSGTSYYAWARAKENATYNAGAAKSATFNTTGSAPLFPHPVDFEADTIGKTYETTKNGDGSAPTVSVVADPSNSGQKSLQVAPTNWNQAPIIPIRLTAALNTAPSISFRYMRTAGNIDYKSFHVLIASDPAAFTDGNFDSNTTNRLVTIGNVNQPTMNSWVERTETISNLNSAISGLSGNVYLAIGFHTNQSGLTYLIDDIKFNFPKSTGAAINGNVTTSLSGTSVTITAALSTTNPGNQTLEYAVHSSGTTAPTTGWQDSNVVTGLTIGTTYYAWARAKENDTHNAGTAKASSSFSIAKSTGVAINGNVTTGSITSGGVTITATLATPNSGSQTLEYAVATNTTTPTTGWQDSNVITGLSASTQYYAYARSKENATHNAGTAGRSSAFTTSASSKSAGVTINGNVTETHTSTSVTITATLSTPNSGNQVREYAISTTNSTPTSGWQTSNTISGLTANTQYYAWARSQENTTHNAGVAKNVQFRTSAQGSGGTPPSVGAVASGNWRNLFVEMGGKTSAQANARVDEIFNRLFVSGNSNQKIYMEVGSDMAYIHTVDSNDVRSEGMSYAMMVAVQRNDKARFDKLWKWAHTYMYHDRTKSHDGNVRGYFAWKRGTNGSGGDEGPAPDGEFYFATSLLFASARWGDGSGINEYGRYARYILYDMLHRQDPRKVPGGLDPYDCIDGMFNKDNKLPVFTTQGSLASTHTDASYILPAFFEVWAQEIEEGDDYHDIWGNDQAQIAADAQFYRDAATEGRKYFAKVTHATTGLGPDYSDWAGNPTGSQPEFRYDAWRIAMNIAMDYAWWAKDSWQITHADRIQSFFKNTTTGNGGGGVTGHGALYNLNGTLLANNSAAGDHSPGLVGCNAVASLAASNVATATEFVNHFFTIDPTEGTYRYYDGSLVMLALLHVSGNFKAYFPTNRVKSAQISPTSATFNKETSHADYKNITVTMTLNGRSLSNIKNGNTTLTQGSSGTNGYTVSGSTVTIRREYLATLSTGSTTLTFNFDAGNSRSITISIGDGNTGGGASYDFSTNPSVTVTIGGDTNGVTATVSGGTLNVSKTSGYSTPFIVLPFNIGTMSTYSKVRIVFTTASGDTGYKTLTVSACSGTTWSGATSIGTASLNGAGTYDVTRTGGGSLSGQVMIGFSLGSTNAYELKISSIELLP